MNRESENVKISDLETMETRDSGVDIPNDEGSEVCSIIRSDKKQDKFIGKRIYSEQL